MDSDNNKGEGEKRESKAGRGNEPLERPPQTQQTPHLPSSPLAGPIWAGPLPTVSALTSSQSVQSRACRAREGGSGGGRKGVGIFAAKKTKR